MNSMSFAPDAIPALPVFGWQTFAAPRHCEVPSLLDMPGMLFTTSGRAAIALGLRVLGVEANDRVLVPTYHCPTMVAPVVVVGARPAYYPITPTGAPSVEYLDTLDTTGVKALIAAHFFGLPQPLNEVRDFCDRRGIALIEDCAHALFGETTGRPVGGWGDVAVGSLTKFYPVTEGGCIASVKCDLRGIMLERRGLAAEIKAFANLLETGAGFRRLTGLNTALCAMFAVSNLARGLGKPTAWAPPPDCSDEDLVRQFDETLVDCAPGAVCRWVVRRAGRSRIVSSRRSSYTVLAERLRRLPDAWPLFSELPGAAVPYVFPLWVDKGEESRYLALKRSGIPVFRWDRLWPDTPALAGDAGRTWSRHVFQLPCHQDLGLNALEHLVEKLSGIFSRTS